jgi:hypothetical protein
MEILSDLVEKQRIWCVMGLDELDGRNLRVGSRNNDILAENATEVIKVRYLPRSWFSVSHGMMGAGRTERQRVPAGSYLEQGVGGTRWRSVRPTK